MLEKYKATPDNNILQHGISTNALTSQAEESSGQPALLVNPGICHPTILGKFASRLGFVIKYLSMRLNSFSKSISRKISVLT
ncbi:protein of unknown function [Legionella hackeliae]|uniref:Uncharacterized protein n=1 Tax=Legionella hackeliae TaxID=449 RepID=A0A0A8UTJ1_LEGHA|nr:protein of unknown function [Legionella hackeliae]